MPGPMTGPIPNRSNQRRRNNEPDTPIKNAPATTGVEFPEPDASWHSVAVRWYKALGVSGQSYFYEPSDVETAWVLAENLSRELKPKVVAVNPVTGEPIRAPAPMNGAALAAFLKGCTVLLATEGDRRRARVELLQPDPAGGDDADVSWLDSARRRAS